MPGVVVPNMTDPVPREPSSDTTYLEVAGSEAEAEATSGPPWIWLFNTLGVIGAMGGSEPSQIAVEATPAQLR